ncbi:hypothetical protein [Kangiella sp. TOML190]|uniref:hypothetical protein n=1 Tax=Kangiella sp. TOML190 TaxID=2931351 RepID=UPI002041BF4E|nr:hypothetical protein [Kangiella sp. TOML190]
MNYPIQQLGWSQEQAQQLVKTYSADIPSSHYYLDVDDEYLVEALLNYFQLTLQTNLKFQDALRPLGINSLEAIKAFEMGYANRSLNRFIPDDDLAIRGVLQRCGWLKASGHERFRYAYIYPLYDIDGNLVGAWGYWLGSGLLDSEAQLLLWNSASYGLSHPEPLCRAKEVLIRATPLQACQSYALGYTNALALVMESLSRSRINSLFASLGFDKVFLHGEDRLSHPSWFELLSEALFELDIPFEVLPVARA